MVGKISELLRGAFDRVAANPETPAKTIAPDAADDDSDFDEPYAMVGARVRPRPYRGSGAIALPEPDDRYPVS
jgi:hypothetical protein